MENWKVIMEFPNYEISDKGRVRNRKNGKTFIGGTFNGYYRVTLRKGNERKSKLVHVLVAEAFIDNPNKKPYIDHINGQRDDNNVGNLRWCTPKENNGNVPKRAGCSSTYKGVHWSTKREKWVSMLGTDYKSVYLGSYDSELEASKAYDLKALEHFGQFAKLNHPLSNYI